MPADTRLFRLAVVCLALVLAVAACGGGGGKKKEHGSASKASKACPEKLNFRLGSVPAGFSHTLVKGPAAGQPEIKNVVIYHVNGPSGRYIELFRGGERHKLPKKGKTARSIGGNIAHVGQITGGYGAKVRLSRGRCSKYQFEGHGLGELDMAKVVGGLKSTV